MKVVSTVSAFADAPDQDFHDVQNRLASQDVLGQLALLFRTTRVLGPTPLATATLVVDPGARHTQVRALLLERARRFGAGARVTLERLDGEGAVYRITVPALAVQADELACALAEALVEGGVGLGRASREFARG